MTNAERQKRWREANPERWAAIANAAQKRYAKAHPEKVRALDRKRYANNAERRASVKARAVIGAHVRRVRIHGAAVGSGADRVTAKAWAEQVEVFGRRCAYCLAPLANAHRDHVIPLARGGAHAMSNLVPACAPCNQSKNARGPLAMLKGR